MVTDQTGGNILAKVARELVAPQKGILAADESTGTMKKRLDAIRVEATPENRSMWREIIAGSQGIEKAISGEILFDETLRTPLPNGNMIADLLKSKNIHPGIKVDLGVVKINEQGETFTQGLDKLGEKLLEYKNMGADFTKWRAVYKVGEKMPSTAAVTANSIGLAEYALLSQRAGLVPIVEPEILVLEGNHDINKSKKVTQQVLKDVFYWLKEFGVQLDGMLLKPNMVLPGKDSQKKATTEEIARLTVETLKATVPAEVPGIVFLSGGLTPDQSTEYLKTMNTMYPGLPWQLSYSFGRALQQEALQVWMGKPENVKAAQDAFMVRAKKVSQARNGK
ncbi:MAG: class I fructose-bisphosphate aldolase [Candidatus Roizmanbacteria bacterium]|nr:class I fructose-bisphosphate aldolase [Candidatus Roizmanbacteria bacterium]